MTICDTNIWYDINSFSETERKSNDLILTPLATKELANSPNLLIRIKDVKLACVNIFKYGNDLILKTPLEYLLSLDKQEYDNQTPYINFSKEFDVICRLSEGAEVSEDKKEALRVHIGIVRTMLQTGTSNLQEMLTEVRKNIVNKKKHQEIDTIEVTKEVINKVFIETPTEGKYTLSDSFNWSQIELFFYSLDAYFKKLEVITTMKINNNDWIDLFNLIYVSPSDKYFTKDRGVIAIIKAAKMEKYFVED